MKIYIATDHRGVEVEKKIIDYLKKYAEAEGIERFVVGYPMNLDNTPSEAAAYVDAFLNLLKNI